MTSYIQASNSAAATAATAATAAPTTPTIIVAPIAELDRLRTVLETPAAQRDLVSLYSDSQAECKRNGKCGMEIGMSREKDLLAVLSDYIGAEVVTDIDNALVEDFRFNAEKISIKHISDAVGKGSMKVKWTSDAEQATKFLTTMLALEPDHYTHMLIVFIDLKAKRITIVCIAAQQVIEIVRFLGKRAFNSATGTNNRGVDYSKEMMALLIKYNYFTVRIEGVDIATGLDPIARRRALLAARRVSTAAAATI